MKLIILKTKQGKALVFTELGIPSKFLGKEIKDFNPQEIQSEYFVDVHRDLVITDKILHIDG